MNKEIEFLNKVVEMTRVRREEIQAQCKHEKTQEALNIEYVVQYCRICCECGAMIPDVPFSVAAGDDLVTK